MYPFDTSNSGSNTETEEGSLDASTEPYGFRSHGIRHIRSAARLATVETTYKAKIQSIRLILI